MIISILLVIVTLGLTLYHCKTHYGRTGKLVNKIPGPTAHPLLGNVWEFMVPLNELWVVLRKIHTKYYPINRIWLGVMPTVSIYHPDDVQIVLSSTKHTEKSQIYSFLHPWLGRGLLTSTGPKWQTRRKMLTPAFHFNILQEFVDVFVEQSEVFVRNLKSDGDEIIKDIIPLLTKFTLDSICETAMGTELTEDESEDSYRNAVLEMGTHVIHRMIRPWLHFDWIFKLTPTGFRQRKVLKHLHQLTNTIIAERKQYHEQKSKENKIAQPKKDHLKGRKERLAMLDILITASNNEGSIDNDGIREEVDTFVFEGHDTTSMGACFLLALLAEHKEIQERVRKEVCEVMKECGGKFGMSDVNKLVYLDRCIKESLRMYPSVPTITRVLHEDLQLKNYLVPAGANVHVYIYDLQRDPHFWPNPTVYDPDRFLPENSRNRHPYAYVPFSGGPRNCIGQKFALLELKVLVAQVLYNFNLEPIDLAHDIIVMQDLVIRPMQAVRVKFVSRVNQNLLESAL
ncbi:cytochrome P450 4C1-like isoform X2 [Belonocnema kinseyi]|uniref:cytochrome P450 4C1-like isoform X2 n=1 Tax=Belonocnema kinseyi TaxID=2817044 RepID=UPI00143CE756|nr:cytochrome P450 4C1-like isoform X2 [Belonocnema kinseyi]